MEDKDGYIPGVCNIGKAELRRRRNSTIYSAVLVIICIVLVQWFEAGRIWRLSIFIPVASFAVCFQQWYFKFCVAFGIKGLVNFGDLGKHFSVKQQESLKKDRAKAIQMIVIGALIGAVATIIYFLLPE